MLNKETVYTVDIFDMSFEGKGTAKVEDIVVFVDDAVVGDKLKIKLTKIKKRYAFGRVVEVVEKSKHRVNPPCQYYTWCGGCDLLHLDYETQCNLKLERVRSILKNSAGVDKDKITEIKGTKNQFAYRNKYYVHTEKRVNSYAFGHFKKASNNLIVTDKCLLADEKTNEIVNRYRDVINNLKYDCRIKNILVRSNKAKTDYLVCLVFDEKRVKDKQVFIDACKDDDKIKGLIFNYNKNYKGDILGRESETLYGDSFLYDEIGDKKFKVEYNSFFQVNYEQTKVLYDSIVELGKFTKDDVVLDAYCGAGTIAIYIADKVKSVVGIEVVDNAIKNANANKELNGVDNVEFVLGTVEEKIKDVINENVTTVILDPPRKGCELEVLDSIIENNVQNIIYVSCKTESLGRDLKYLEEKGYELEGGVAVDMFINSVLVETVVRITKRKM